MTTGDASGEKVPWHQRVRKEWDLRYEGIRFVLIWRFCDENGLDSGGQPSLWRDAALIEEWKHAKALLDACRAHEAAVSGRTHP